MSARPYDADGVVRNLPGSRRRFRSWIGRQTGMTTSNRQTADLKVPLSVDDWAMDCCWTMVAELRSGVVHPRRQPRQEDHLGARRRSGAMGAGGRRAASGRGQDRPPDVCT